MSVLRAAALTVTIVVTGLASAPTRGTLPPVGAREPSSGARLSACDPGTLAPPRKVQGACRSTDGVRVVFASTGHAVALRDLTAAVKEVVPVDRIPIGSGSIGPLDPSADRWFSVTMQVRNTSGRTIQFDDQQLELRVGDTNYAPHPEATSSVLGSLTRSGRRFRTGVVDTGAVVFEIPVQQVSVLDAGPATLLFCSPKGDFDFGTFPRHVVGAIQLK